MRSLEEIKSNRYLEIKKEGKDGFGGTFYERKSRCYLNFIMSWGAGWEHCSVSMPTRCPSWEQMCAIKDLFFKEEECCVEYHPAKDDYVNNHPYCLHIWRPINEDLPKPPSIMVGVKRNYSKDEIDHIKDIYMDLPRW